MKKKTDELTTHSQFVTIKYQADGKTNYQATENGSGRVYLCFFDLLGKYGPSKMDEFLSLD